MSIKYLVRCLCVAFLVGTVYSGHGLAQETQMQSVDALITQSGLERQVGQLPEVILASFDDRLSQETVADPAIAAKVKDIMSQAFNPQALISAFKDDIKQKLTQPDIEAILSWLNSPLGKKITQLEENASSTEAYSQMQAFALEFEKTPPASDRKEIFNELDQAAHISEYSVQMKIDMIKTMAQSAASASGQADFSIEQVNRQIEQSRIQIEETSRKETLVSGCFTYQTLSNEELKQYVEFYKTPSGQKYAWAVTQSLLKVFQDASRVMGEKIGAEIKGKAAAL